MTSRQYHPRCIVLRLFLRWWHCFSYAARGSTKHLMLDGKSRKGGQVFWRYTPDGVTCSCGRKF